MNNEVEVKCPRCSSVDVVYNGGKRMLCKGCGYGGAAKFFKPTKLLEQERAESEASLRRRIANLEAQNKALSKESFEMAEIRKMVNGISSKIVTEAPAWVYKSAFKQGKVIHGIPTLFLSDLHFGEVVFENQVNGVNSYNTEIAKKRLKRVVEGSIRYLRETLSPGHFGGVVCNLGGDMVDGAIHDELRDTADETVMESVLTLHDELVPHLKTLADEFGRVFGACVAGNHGRMDRKPRCKNRAVLNFDWLLYQFIQRSINADPKYRDKITLMIPDGPDASYRVHNVRYLLTHGDKFTGGNGITGPLLPWMRGDMKTRKQYGAMRLPYDTLIMGHWHQLRFLEGIIVNGCLPGFNEYALLRGFGFEPPQQALWITSPTRGITISEGIWGDEAPPSLESEWLSLRQAK